MAAADVALQYERIKKLAKADLRDSAITEAIREATRHGLDFLLTQAGTASLESDVPGKTYSSFELMGKLSRPINQALFDHETCLSALPVLGTEALTDMASEQITSVLYTTAMAFCATNDLLKRADQKTPGTYFEYMIGHLFARQFGVNPKTSIEVLNLDETANIPTDFVFDTGVNQAKFHVPVKISTRERVIQVWAHQRIIDGVYGAGRFKGLLVTLTETKLDRQSLRVIEICLPQQWKVYQRFVARLERVYYLDVPTKYAALASGYPAIAVKPFGDFFAEKDQLLA